MTVRFLIGVMAMIMVAPTPVNADTLVDTCRIDSVCLTYRDSKKTVGSIKNKPISPFALPYSVTGNSYDWHRLWINTATLSGAFVGTLLVLECLPEDATSWNRAELQDVPLFKRWHNHVIKRGPEWDHDKFYFNYILHPYAGATYFMAARSCGFNFWKSTLYGSIISTVGWEFGIEAFMERPSIQDLFVYYILPNIFQVFHSGYFPDFSYLCSR